MQAQFDKHFKPAQLLYNEPMAGHTSFGVGGPADLLFLPRNTQDIKEVISICQEAKIPYFVMGNGTNLLVKDNGFRGVVIKLYNPMSQELQQITVMEGCILQADAGAMLSVLADTCLEHAFAGFEFASGIPGTVGGAICMNAGAYEGEMKDVVVNVDVLSESGQIKRMENDALAFGYRTSKVKEEELLVVGATIRLKPGNAKKIANEMQALNQKRREKQPDDKSAGSTFKRPPKLFAGKLIEDSGLKGCAVGGAMVSPVHCGFIVNRGGALAADILALMEHVQQTVQKNFGVILEPEVKIIGE